MLVCIKCATAYTGNPECSHCSLQERVKAAKVHLNTVCPNPDQQPWFLPIDLHAKKVVDMMVEQVEVEQAITTLLSVSHVQKKQTIAEHARRVAMDLRASRDSRDTLHHKINQLESDALLTFNENKELRDQLATAINSRDAIGQELTDSLRMDQLALRTEERDTAVQELGNLRERMQRAIDGPEGF